MELFFVGDSIECQECEFITRKIVPSVPLIDKILGRVIKYDCSRNCEVKNIEELNPKKYILRLTSNLELNTILKADSIYLLTKKLKPIKVNVINKSGRHKASHGIIDAYTYAEIKYPLENVLNSIIKRTELN